MSNIYAVHFDPVTWPEPEVFNPSRHLTAEGKIIKKDEFIPFAIGKFWIIHEISNIIKREFKCENQYNINENF